ncbi:hypothetical protein [Dyadobacter helix]|nr:hypothetical protein [Dyadobacter sp. CECT 9275]
MTRIRKEFLAIWQKETWYIIVVINRKAEGLYKRTFRKNDVLISIFPFTRFNKWQTDGIEATVHKLGKYLNKNVVIQ